MPRKHRNASPLSRGGRATPFLTASLLSLFLFLICSPLLPATAESPAPRSEQPDAPAPEPPAAPRVEETFGKLPLQFEPNRGQADRRVKFLARGQGYNLFLTATEAVLALRKGDGRKGEPNKPRAPRSAAVLRMSLRGANPSPAVEGADPLTGKVNYFVGNDRSRWRTNVETFARVKYSAVYPGVDLVYYGNQGRLEYDFVVAPGADPRAIRLAFKGADRVELAANGDLVIRVAGGEVRQPKPVVYQTAVGGARREVAGEYVLKGRREVGFRLGEYDTSAQLVIDPVLLYSTYLGGSDAESATAVAFDPQGGVYITGTTSSFDFPVTPGAAQTTRRPLSGTQIYYGDGFVMKLNPSGTAIEYATYIGGSVGGEVPTGIDVDEQGNAYVAGNTGGGATASGYANDFPTVNAFDPTPNSYDDSFVLKLNPTGSQLLYSTYLASGWANSLVVDKATGEAYVVGGTGPNFPTTPGAFKTQIGSTETDGFLAKFAADGRSLVYATYLGGSAAGNAPNDIAIDAEGNAYLVGETTSPNFPVTPNGSQTTCTGCDLRRSDGYLLKFNPTGSGVLYGTLIGGSSYETANGVALDTQGNIYVTGGTSSGNATAKPFAVTPGALNKGINGGGGYVIKYNPSGAVVYSAIYAPQGTADIAVDAAGNAYVVGSVSTAYSSTFPLVEPFSGFIGSGSHVFIAGVNPAGSALTFSTLFGKGHARRVVADGSGNIYVAGEALNGELPLASPIKSSPGLDPRDGFVAKIAVTGPRSAAAHIYGQLVSTDGSSPQGFTMKLTGSQTGLIVTDAQGRYSFPVKPGGTYTVEPVRADWNFSPRSQTFTNVTADTQAEVTYSAANIRPEARMVSPVAGATYKAPATVLLKVEASDADGTVQRVEFFNNNGGLLFVDTEAPYEFEWKNVPASDTWGVSAMVYDNTPSSTFVQWVNFVVEPEAGAAAPRFEFSSPTYAVGESAGTAAITVTRSGKTDVAASVEYATNNHMANAPSDFTAASGTLNFAAGETSKTFNVSIVDDSVYESDETLSLHLLRPSSNAILGDQSLAALAITNEDSAPTLAVNDVTLAEGNSGTTAFTFTVTRTGPTEVPLSFAFATADGTARDDNPVEEDNDYQAVGGTVSLLPSEASKTLTVVVNGDTAGEADENFFVNLSNPAGATIADAQAAGTITNDDVAAPSPTPTPVPGERINYALASNGATAVASSEFRADLPAASVINGDRRSQFTPDGRYNFWHSGAGGAKPDWIEVRFAGPRTVTEVDVVTLQDGFTDPVEPTEEMTFSSYGIRDFDVRYWDGSGWVTVPAGSVVGNDRVLRRFTFPAVTTDRIRVVVRAAADGWSRVMEVEAWGGGAAPSPTPTPTPAPTPSPAPSPTPGVRVNYALASNGATVRASSLYRSDLPAEAVIDGDRRSQFMPDGRYNFWHSGAGGSKPDWLEINFGAQRSVDEVGVVTLQDRFTDPVEPTEQTTFSLYGVTGYEVQYWDGARWTAVPGASVSGNNRVWKRFSFPAVTTDRIRLVINAAADGWSRVMEVEAWGGGSAPPPAGRVNHALASNGGTAAASSLFRADLPAEAVINGDRRSQFMPDGRYNFWHSGAGGAKPDWIEVRFAGPRTISEIGVVTLQDGFTDPVEPTEQTTFRLYGVTNYEVQYWAGSGWVAAPGASVSGNDRVWRRFTFPAVTTDRIRLVVHAAADGWSRIVEVEAY